MNYTPKKVNVLIESCIDDQNIVQKAEGDLYPKGSHYYLRYEEMDPEMKGTVTTIRLERDSIRIIRRGHLRSEQTFISGRRLHGYYDTAQGKIELETVTNTIFVDLIDGMGIVEWSYELYLMGEKSGAYRLRLIVTERE
jgi:uncharacterized beta-barrel protein YwiB (DUF1934 family)